MKVDCDDLRIVTDNLGSKRGQVGYMSVADLNGDGIVDTRDMQVIEQAMPETMCK